MSTPVLVAPRPVRFANSLITTRNRILQEPERAKSAASDENNPAVDPLDKDIPPSQRSSPRSGLPSEALEEFLSILRPAFFPPPSPVLFTRRPGSVTLPFTLKGRGLFQSDLVGDGDVSRSPQPTCTPDNIEEELEANILPIPARWFTSNVLSSPISRMHTRNPLSRHILSPSPISPIALSPAAVPLPLPTPDEHMLLEVA
ncbi:hypothetical protein MKEN_01058500 [Mycena kentingensis (nom. inval.)]|nr:hypothetical protein MKEN_01058500 [Mycena kentingensis (nom. inval.)]